MIKRAKYTPEPLTMFQKVGFKEFKKACEKAMPLEMAITTERRIVH